MSDLSVEHNVGIALYIISEVKQLDLETGGKVQIAIVNKDGYKELSFEEQAKCYQSMIDNLYSSFIEYFDNKDRVSKIFKHLFAYE